MSCHHSGKGGERPYKWLLKQKNNNLLVQFCIIGMLLVPSAWTFQGKTMNRNFFLCLLRDTRRCYTASDRVLLSAWPSFQEKQLPACICTNSLAAVQCSGGRYIFLCAALLKDGTAHMRALLKISSLQTQRKNTIPASMSSPIQYHCCYIVHVKF